MAAVEQRIARESTLRLVQASGHTAAFATGSAAATKLVAFCEEVRATITPPEYMWPRDRGVLQPPKRVNDGGPYPVEFRLASVNTGSLVTIAQAVGTASGASVPKLHAEIRAATDEDPTLTGVWHQFHHGVVRDCSFEEGEPNVWRLRMEFWSATINTASGYLS